MEIFIPYFTGDGSVGLYSDEYDDIYHSADGALSEAYEKFIFPLSIDKNKDIKVLDVCYGLGYNSKTFLNALGLNYEHQITFDCLDINKDLFFLSPFVNTNNKINNSNNLKDFNPEIKNKIKTYFNNKKLNKYKIDDWVNKVIIKNLLNQYKNEIDLPEILKKHENKKILSHKMLFFAKNYQKSMIKHTKFENKMAFLHNIYYKYISIRYNMDKFNKIKFNFYNEDARKSIKKLHGLYDFIFLDAFTPKKCPQLWSLDFVERLYNLIDYNGILITYSRSAVVRNTFKCAGFYIGKTLDKNNKTIGTICSKNKSKIKYNLSEYELELLNTKSGIPYRDLDLNLSNEEITKNRDIELNNSNLISVSKYIKEYKEKVNEI